MLNICSFELTILPPVKVGLVNDENVDSTVVTRRKTILPCLVEWMDRNAVVKGCCGCGKNAQSRWRFRC